MTEFQRLFAPGRIGALEVSNRIVMPPMGTTFATEDGEITDATIAYFSRRAAGGAGMLASEAMNVHYRCVAPHKVNAYDDRFLPGLSRLAATMKSGGSKAICQVYHRGSQTTSQATGYPLIAPSAVPTFPAHQLPEPASMEMIHEVIEAFAKAAARAKQAGFDAVEFHGAHGYLISTFLSPARNKRQDEFGGDTARRARFAVEIVKRTRELVGNFPIIFRLSLEDGIPDGLQLSEGLEVARMLEQAGVDALSISSGIFDRFDLVIPSMELPQNFRADLGKTARSAVRIPVMLAGRINEPAVAEAALADGAADFVCIGRGLLADPDFAVKAREGRADEIRRCVGCNHCVDEVMVGATLRCLMNPECGREGDFQIRTTDRPKRVVVVGGGPAGMQAAAIMARRGHNVELYERAPELGGKLPLCAAAEWKRGFQTVNDYLKTQLARSGAHVKVGQKLTADLVAKEAPDAVVLACGAEPIVPEVPGLAGRAVLADDVWLGKVDAGHKIFIIGAGYTGCELAIMLARRGHQVTIARRGSPFELGLGLIFKWTMLPELQRLGIRMLSGVAYEAVDEDGIVVSKNNERERVPADSLIVAAGYRPTNELAGQLAKMVPELHVIGDCAQPRTLLEAMHEGALVAVSI